MTDEEIRSVEFGACIPVLRIFDEDKAREFYVDYLGFTVDWEHRFETGMPLYMQVSRGSCALHLTEHHGDCTPGSAVRIDIRDVDGYRRELHGKAYGYARPGVESAPWARELAVQDPFGNRLIFAERKASSS